MITPYTLLRHELHGLPVRVDTSKDQDQQGIEGVVVGETKNTLKILTKTGSKIAKKDQTVFEFKLPDESVVRVSGRLIRMRAEDRIKKKVRITYQK